MHSEKHSPSLVGRYRYILGTAKNSCENEEQAAWVYGLISWESWYWANALKLGQLGDADKLRDSGPGLRVASQTCRLCLLPLPHSREVLTVRASRPFWSSQSADCEQETETSLGMKPAEQVEPRVQAGRRTKLLTSFCSSATNSFGEKKNSMPAASTSFFYSIVCFHHSAETALTEVTICQIQPHFHFLVMFPLLVMLVLRAGMNVSTSIYHRAQWLIPRKHAIHFIERMNNCYWWRKDKYHLFSGLP